MKPLIELKTVMQLLQEMRNAFQLFDRDGDGTINAKVAIIKTLPRNKAKLSCVQELGSVMKTMGMQPSEDSLAVTFIIR